jgi:hypothetical protein
VRSNFGRLLWVWQARVWRASFLGQVVAVCGRTWRSGGGCQSPARSGTAELPGGGLQEWEARGVAGRTSHAGDKKECASVVTHCLANQHQFKKSIFRISKEITKNDSH